MARAKDLHDHLRARLSLGTCVPVNTPEQLVLALGHGVSFAREDFLEGPSNAAALALIERWPDWPARSIVLVGPEGSGKSHLAEIDRKRTRSSSG